MSNNFRIYPEHCEWYIVDTQDFVILPYRVSAFLFLQAVNPNKLKYQTALKWTAAEIASVPSALADLLGICPHMLTAEITQRFDENLNTESGVSLYRYLFPEFPPFLLVTVVRPNRSSNSTINKSTGFYTHFGTIVGYGTGTLAIKTLKPGNYWLQ